MKDILVVWHEVPEQTRLYAIPYNEQLLDAHCGFVNSQDNSRQQHDALQNLQTIMQKHKPLDPSQPVDLAGYSKLIVCGILL